MKYTGTALLILCLLAIVAVVPSVPPVRASKTSPVVLTFDKHATGSGIWSGTVGGDGNGELTTTLTNLRTTGAVWPVEFDWQISSDDAAHSFTAQLRGTLNTETGSVVMSGTVVDGWLAGARVHQVGQLIDPETQRFQGTLRILPATVAP